MTDYVVLETGYTDRYEPHEYDTFDFVGSVDDYGELIQGQSEVAEDIRTFLRLSRGYLIFRTKPDVDGTTPNDIQHLIEQINSIPYCAFFEWNQLMFTNSTPWVHRNQRCNIIVYTFDTESG